MHTDLEQLLIAVHQRLEALLRAHQVALIDRDGAAAQTRWREFASLLEAHMVDEEELLLPLFAERGGEQLPSSPRQFATEHQQARKLVAQLDEALQALSAPPSHEQVLELLERESRFRALLLHHDLRERRVLYPRLCAWTTEQERQALAARLRAR